jgi:hypothetical protein
MNWVHELSVGWLIVVVFAGMSLGTAGIYGAVTRVAVGERARAFKALSPGMLPSMGLVFGLIVGFHVAGLWSELGEARNAVNREASSLRSADLVAGASFPGPTKARIDALIGRHIHDTVAREWPVMARGDATLKVVPAPLADALRVALEIEPHGENEVTAQRELVSSLQGALDARRQLIILSGSTVNWLRWTGVIALVPHAADDRARAQREPNDHRDRDGPVRIRGGRDAGDDRRAGAAVQRRVRCQAGRPPPRPPARTLERTRRGGSAVQAPLGVTFWLKRNTLCGS